VAVAIGREYYYLNYSAILFRQRRWKGFQFMNRSFMAILVLFAICVTPDSRTITSQTKDYCLGETTGTLAMRLVSRKPDPRTVKSIEK